MLKNLKKISIIKDKESGSSKVNSDLNYDRITKTNTYGEIILPIGHYALINRQERQNNSSPIISIYGLGSCIALILYDKLSCICGVSHILLPKRTERKNIKYPHKFADLSVKKLVEELINQGAKRERIKAIIIGGSKIFNLDNNIIGDENIRITKQELNKLNIEIYKESIGGSQGRVIQFNTKSYITSIKIVGESEFHIL